MCLNPGVAVLAVFLNGTIAVSQASYEPRCYDHVPFFKTLQWTNRQWWKAKTKRQFLAAQSVRVRTVTEVEIDTARINAMKADALGVPINKLKKCYVIENGQRRWHMREKCK